MILNNSTRNILVQVVSYATVVLFVYAAVSKIITFEAFQAQLGQSPLTSVYADLISYGLIGSELVLAISLCFSFSQSFALKAATFLMLLFTAYIIVILNFSSVVPCTCGGLLEKLDWHSHLGFNSIVIVALTCALLLQSKSWMRTLFLLLSQIVISSTLISVLYFSSEHVLHKENPFVRRFDASFATKQLDIKLQNNSLYFAGSAYNSIYLGDSKAPLHVIRYDTLLQDKRIYKIELDSSNYRFSSVQIQVRPPYFYVMDGTVPVFYKGRISDWNAHTVVSEQGYYFSKATVTDSLHLIFRTQQFATGENALGLLDFSQGIRTTLDANLLEKQIDGFFDTDGMLNYDTATNTFVYLYYYRNQFIVTSSNLKLSYRGHTIDTTTIAKLVPTYISKTKQRKLASPSNPVNKISNLSQNILFVNSTLRGKFEPKEMWDIASIIDVYDIKNNRYLSSFYIYSNKEAPLKDILVLGNSLYAIVGNELHKYKLKKF